MAADEHLRRSFDALAARLRDEMSRHFESASTDLAASIDAEHAQVVAQAADEHARALAQLSEEHEKAIADARQGAREEAEQDAERRRSSAVQEAEIAAREQGREEGLEQGRSEGRVEGLEQARAEGRTEGFEQGRAEGLEQGRAEGLERRHAEGREEERPSEILLEAIRAMDRATSISDVLDTLVNAAARAGSRAGVVLVHDNHLRAWRFTGSDRAASAASDAETPPAEAAAIGEAVRTAGVVSGHGAAAFPMLVGGQVAAVLCVDAGDRASGTDASWPNTLELLARHAARSLEAVTAFRGAQVFTNSARPGAIPSEDRSPDDHSASAVPRSSGEAEESARRYARLLISEIKLYHEPAVVAGRRDGNLAKRLAGEIARARVLYEQRIPAPVRDVRDYFHEELVSTLADGDAQLLANR